MPHDEAVCRCEMERRVQAWLDRKQDQREQDTVARAAAEALAREQAHGEALSLLIKARSLEAKARVYRKKARELLEKQPT